MTIASAALALRAAVVQRLASDATLATLIGAARVYDEPPRAALPPYVVLAMVESSDVSGDLAPAAEHRLTLEVWSRQGGLAEALKAANRVVDRLDGADLALDGWRLVDLAWRSTRAERMDAAGLRRAELAFRAVTEPLH